MVFIEMILALKRSINENYNGEFKGKLYLPKDKNTRPLRDIVKNHF